MSDFWFIFSFFLKTFGRGFLTGIIIRFIVAVYTKTDFTLGGTIRLAIFVGIVNIILTVIRLYF